MSESPPVEPDLDGPEPSGLTDPDQSPEPPRAAEPPGAAETSPGTASPDSGSPGIPTPPTQPTTSVGMAAPESRPTAADPRVDDALSRLAEVDSLPLTEQVEVYADIHRRLAGVLSDPDSQA